MPARRPSQPQNALQSYGVLFPFGQYTLLNSLLTSVACYIALGLVIIVAVFPETVNHAALVSTSDLIGKVQGIVGILGQILESSPEDLAPGTPLATKLQGARMSILMHMQQRECILNLAAMIIDPFSRNSESLDNVHRC